MEFLPIKENYPMSKILILIFSLFMLLSCSASKLYVSDRREGFLKNNLRVFVRNQIPEDVDYTRAVKEFPDASKQLSDKRAVLLVFSKIYSDSPGFISFEDLQPDVKAMLDSGKRIQSECFEYFCEAFYDYDISALELKLGKIWKTAN